ncbi:hypothetical protein UFOVP1078_11 [uncultured Caudovirales phage]|uniref:Holin of 3TMs, for gene-transfer release n=3 Tax=uncultured Caudovirales phage TaxID=2100421 RepID=A0A6J5PL35_9CAUD|nr:hypothetical protein UFOVP289_22 [uncultured Caudovirales phage]CAB4150019.1 hypothetical protein UFOVP547_25 [uncultured Caudovirales phage]CAB4170061.1 hypothetical protein UFOVP900_44 [uncultured Caudovirales phage]CAB4182558.1 hypothetical protein UFOVP1078_11 [uncultured Caudovirales phage]CAB4210937.1 hypothetical protein UFOVP1429_59 [uncultured Caudovirales phage]
MFTLLTTVISFLSGGVPKLLDFFQDRADKKHEVTLAQMQTEREMALKKAGLEVQERIEHIQTEQIQITSNVTERQALYAHDIAIGQGASTWVVNARAMVRPAITYGMFILFAFVEIFGFVYAWKSGVTFDLALDKLWDDDTQTIWASIVSFWFGTQAFSKK